MNNKATNKRHKPAAPHPWDTLSKLAEFSIAELRILHEHHAALHRFCIDPETAEEENASSSSVSAAAESAPSPIESYCDSVINNDDDDEDTALALSFEQYCVCLHTLIKYGTSVQQFEYLFQTYAIESERGISRTELFQLLQDHYSTPPVSRQGKDRGSESTAQARHFERLYTWLKKHVTLYDRARCGYLPVSTTLDMLATHSDALYLFRFQVSPFIKKMEENNKHYRTKAQAAAIQV